jgi:hypothetical protein
LNLKILSVAFRWRFDGPQAHTLRERLTETDETEEWADRAFSDVARRKIPKPIGRP